MNKNKCLFPYNNVTKAANGVFKPCCRYKVSSNNFHNMRNHSTVLDAFKSDEFQDIRDQMDSGEMVEGCFRCYEEDKVGISLRQKSFTTFKTDEIKLRSIELSFSNHCNLRCLMCSPYESTQWVKFCKRYDVSDISWLSRIETPHHSYNILENVELSGIEKFKIVGGEPFVDEKFYEFLTNLDGSKSIEISTNCTLFPEKYIEILKRFKTVSIYLSVDGIGKPNDYIRRPSVWDNVNSVIKKWKQTPFVLKIKTTISVFNVDQISTIEAYANNLGIEILGTLLSFPLELNIKNLPDGYKQQLINEIGDDLITERLKEKSDSFQFEQMKKYIRYMDKIDGTDLRSVNSDLGDLIYGK